MLNLVPWPVEFQLSTTRSLFSWDQTKTNVFTEIGKFVAVPTNAEPTKSFSVYQKLGAGICCNCSVIKIGNFGLKWEKSFDNLKFLNFDLCERNAGLKDLIERIKSARQHFEAVIESDRNFITIKVYVKHTSILDVGCWSPFSVISSRNVIALVSFFFPKLVNRIQSSIKRENEDVDYFYHSLSKKRPELTVSLVANDEIVPILRPYQNDAIRFMLMRELNPSIGDCDDSFILLPTSPPLTFSTVSGVFFTPNIKPEFRVSRGGILADEMGLGKTVEILGLIMAHRRYSSGLKTTIHREHHDEEVLLLINNLISNVVAAVDCSNVLNRSFVMKQKKFNVCGSSSSINSQRFARILRCHCGDIFHSTDIHWDRFDSTSVDFQCLRCTVDVLPVRTTLIIAPETICFQWYEEVKRHIRANVRVDIYSSVMDHGYMPPQYISSLDILICSLETLKKEVYHCEGPDRLGSLRSTRRKILPTPLLLINWWRICIDEAQMVESTSSIIFEMCWKLSAINRWCVTGTPVVKSLENLYGLVSFLKIEPFSNLTWWKNAIWSPYECGDISPMVDLFSKIMWRSKKSEISDQIDFGSMHVEVTELFLNPLEQLMYKEKLMKCSRQFTVARFSTDRKFGTNVSLRDLSKHDFSTIMKPLQHLRQHISFPVSITKVKTSTSEAMHQTLVRDTCRRIEVLQREIVYHLNGLAGCGWLEGDFAKVGSYYQRVISAIKSLDSFNIAVGFTSDNWPWRKLRTDSLQQIHMLNGVIDLANKGINVEGLNVDEATNVLRNLQNKYVHQSTNAVCDALNTIGNYLKKDFLSEINIGLACFLKSLKEIENHGTFHRVSESLEIFLDQCGTKISYSNSSNGIYLIVSEHYNDLAESSQRVIDNLKSSRVLLDHLKDGSSLVHEQVTQIIECHISPSKKHEKCALCLLRKEVDIFGLLLYASSTKKIRNVDSRKLSSAEFIVSSVQNVLMNLLGASHELAAGTSAFIECGNEFKKLFHKANNLLDSSEHIAKQLDEINMCKMRMQIGDPKQVGGEFVDDMNQSDRPKYFLLKSSVEETCTSHRLALQASELMLNRLFGKLRYLINIRNEKTPGVCPICLSSITVSWMLFPCAHCACLECYYRMIYESHLFGATCPQCRGYFKREEVVFVTYRLPTNEMDSGSISLSRCFSIKLDAVIMRVKSIINRDPRARLLVFTCFQRLITVMCQALTENSVEFRCFLDGTRKQEILTEFRMQQNIKVLVLPMNLGGCGLNLTVANHVIFLEPQMNAAAVAQAIGRIYRIGQSQDVFVHHFVTQDTIEKSIYLNSSADASDFEWTLKSVSELLKEKKF